MSNQITVIQSESKTFSCPAAQRFQLPSVSLYWMDCWISQLDCKPQSKKTMANNLSQFYSWMKEKRIKSPTRQDLMSFRDELLAQGKKPNTVKNYLTSLQAFLRWLESTSKVLNEQNPVVPIYTAPDPIKPPRLSKNHSKIPPTVDEVRGMLEYYSGEDEISLRNRAIVLLLAGTGLRTVSVSQARLCDLDGSSGQRVLWYKGKGRDDYDQFVKIPTELDELIKKYLDVRFGCQERDQNSPLFASTAVSTRGQAISTRTIRGLVKEALRAVGEGENSRITAHSLRHFFGTQNINESGTIEETMDVLGHSSPRQTLGYVHSLNREKNQSEKRVVDLILRES